MFTMVEDMLIEESWAFKGRAKATKRMEKISRISNQDELYEAREVEVVKAIHLLAIIRFNDIEEECEGDIKLMGEYIQKLKKNTPDTPDSREMFSFQILEELELLFIDYKISNDWEDEEELFTKPQKVNKKSKKEKVMQ